MSVGSIPIFPLCLSAGSRVATTWFACIKNWWRKAPQGLTTVFAIILPVNLPSGKKNGVTNCELAPVRQSSKPAAFLFLRRPEDLEEEEQEKLQELRHLSEEVELAYDLVQQFARDAADAHRRAAR